MKKLKIETVMNINTSPVESDECEHLTPISSFAGLVNGSLKFFVPRKYTKPPLSNALFGVKRRPHFVFLPV